MANVLLPRIVPDKTSQVKNFLVRQGPNLPPAASRRRYSVFVTDVEPKILPGIAVSSVAQKNSIEFVHVDHDSGRNSSTLGYQDGRTDSSLEVNPLATASSLRIEGHATQRMLQALNDQDYEEWEEDDEDDVIDDGNIDPSSVKWDDFNDKHLLQQNLDLFLNCKKVDIQFDVAKPDFIDGLLVVPVFHCPKCLECWNRTRNLPETCVEAAQPTRGKPIALDETANETLLNQENVNIIHVRERRKKRRRIKNVHKRRNTLATAFGYDTVPVARDSQDNIEESLLHEDSQGMRKYGGLNKSEAEMFVRMSSSKIAKDKSKRSTYSDSGKGSFDSLDTSSSTGFQKKSKDQGMGSLASRLTRVVNAAVEANKSELENAPSDDKTNNLSSQLFRAEKSLNRAKISQHRNSISDIKSKGKASNKILNNIIDINDSKRVGLISIDEFNVLSDIGKDLSPSVGLHSRQSIDINASPSQLAKMKRNKKVKSINTSRKNSFASHKSFNSKHTVSTCGGGGVLQIVEPDHLKDDSNKFRKSSIPVGFDEQYLMQGNKELVQNRPSRMNSTTTRGRTGSSIDAVGMSNIVTNVSSSAQNPSGMVFQRTESGKIVEQPNNKYSDVTNAKLQGKHNRRTSSKDTKSAANRTNGKSMRRSDFDLPPVERCRGSPCNSKELLSPSSSTNGSRPSSRSHLSCLDSMEELNISMKSTGKSTKGKLTAKERLYASLEISRRKQSVFGKYHIFNKQLPTDRIDATIDRANLTPSPKLTARIPRNDMMCMKMRQFTNSFTFSFYDMPVQYKKHNESVTRTMNNGVALSSRKKRK